MTAIEVMARAAEEGIVLSPAEGGLCCEPAPTGETLTLLKEHKTAILRTLVIEARALKNGWTRDADGDWQFPVEWKAQASELVVTLMPLTEKERRQIRVAGASFPSGVSYGQTPDGRWRRLT